MQLWSSAQPQHSRQCSVADKRHLQSHQVITSAALQLFSTSSLRSATPIISASPAATATSAVLHLLLDLCSSSSTTTPTATLCSSLVISRSRTCAAVPMAFDMRLGSNSATRATAAMPTLRALATAASALSVSKKQNVSFSVELSGELTCCGSFSRYTASALASAVGFSFNFSAVTAQLQHLSQLQLQCGYSKTSAFVSASTSVQLQQNFSNTSASTSAQFQHDTTSLQSQRQHPHCFSLSASSASASAQYQCSLYAASVGASAFSLSSNFTSLKP